MTGSQNHENPGMSYSKKVGDRLRAIRRQKRLSLQDVELHSEQEFKASVLGAYERGERSISVARLERLALYYNVPVDQLLPVSSHSHTADFLDLTNSKEVADGVTIDLTKIDAVLGTEGEMLSRYFVMIQVQRQDFNGRVLTIREDDLRAVACILGVEIENVHDSLSSLGIMKSVSRK